MNLTQVTFLSVLLCSSLWTHDTRARELTLSQPAVSKTGNLIIEARGTPGAAAIVELSPNLVDWTGGDPVELADGTNTLFLRPSATHLFCRLRPAEPSEVPKPARFTPVPNTDFIRTGLGSDEGVSLKLEDDNGFGYEFTLNPDSALDLLNLTLQVVNETRGLPPGLTYLGGVTVAPAGTVIFGDATLAIVAPPGTDLGHCAVIAWDAGGTELHFVPFALDSTRAVIPVGRLGGFGLVRLNGGDISAVTGSVPGSLAARSDHTIALASLNPPRPFALHAQSRSDRFDCGFVNFWMHFIPGRISNLRAAIADDALLENALYSIRGLASNLPMMSEPCFDPVRAMIDQCDSLAMQAILASVDNAANRCRRDRNLLALVRVWRSALLATRGSWSRKMSLAQHEHIRDVLHELLEFKVEILSSTSAGSKAGTVRTSVSSEVQATWQLVVLEGGARKLKISGDAAMTVDDTAWIPGVCTAAPAPSEGHVYVKYLRLENLQTDVDHLILGSDGDLPLPRYVLLIDPMVPPPSENYTLFCPPAPPTKLVASHWATAFGSLHKDEVVREGANSVYLIKGFTHLSLGDPDKKEYYRTGKADALDVTESTTINITFLGGSR